jgi:colanic acid/amylovoran biosynthesis glycosyltransferase
MKIAYLVPEFPGQTHIFFWREIEALSKLGVDVKLVSTRPPPQSNISHSWSELAQSGTLYLGEIGAGEALRAAIFVLLCSPLAWARTVRAALSGASIKRIPRNLALILFGGRLAAFMHREKLDHVHVHSCGDAAMLAMLANRLTGMNYSLSLHGPIEDYGTQQHVKFRHAAFALVITRQLLERLNSYLGTDAPNSIGIAPMGVDTEKFQRRESYKPWTGGPLRLFSCGRLNFVKGHQELIQTVSILRKAGIDAQLEIAGEDDDGGSGFRKTLEDLIAVLGLKESVRLVGAVSEQRVYEGLCSAHLFVLASHHEPLGVAIMEAMSCGTPVVSTNLGGVTELIDHGHNGLLVDPKNPKILADAIRQAITTPGLLGGFSIEGRKKIIVNFKSDRSAHVLQQLIAAKSSNVSQPIII